jgi:hypothetical protein
MIDKDLIKTLRADKSDQLKNPRSCENTSNVYPCCGTCPCDLRDRLIELDDKIRALGPILDILPDAVAAAEKAMHKYPQPNYVISKWAEETGEVTKDLIHLAEDRQTPAHLRGEIVQSLAMLHRLLVEGDQVHGLLPVAPMFSTTAPED